MGNAVLYDGMNRDGFLDPLCGLIMGETAENLAGKYQIPREEQDEIVLRTESLLTSGYAVEPRSGSRRRTVVHPDVFGRGRR